MPVLGIGSTDANIPISKGLPAICVGLTQGSGAHTIDEWIAVDQLELAAEIYYRIACGADVARPNDN